MCESPRRRAPRSRETRASWTSYHGERAADTPSERRRGSSRAPCGLRRRLPPGAHAARRAARRRERRPAPEASPGAPPAAGIAVPTEGGGPSSRSPWAPISLADQLGGGAGWCRRRAGVGADGRGQRRDGDRLPPILGGLGVTARSRCRARPRLEKASSRTAQAKCGLNLTLGGHRNAIGPPVGPGGRAVPVAAARPRGAERPPRRGAAAVRGRNSVRARDIRRPDGAQRVECRSSSPERSRGARAVDHFTNPAAAGRVAGGRPGARGVRPPR